MVPHAERQTNNIRRQIGDPSGAGIGNNHRHFGLLDDRRERDRRWREHETGKEVHLVVGDQFGGDRLGGGAGRRPLIALDQFDRIRRDILGVQLDVEIEGLVDLMTEVGIGAAKRQHHADFDVFGMGGADHCQRQGGKPQPFCKFHRVLP